MDEPTTHDDDLNSDIVDDDEKSPADTDDSDDRKGTAEEVKEQQKNAWLKKLKDGKTTLEDMPSNLDWLKKDEEFNEFRKPAKKKVDEDELDARVEKALKARSEKEDFNYLVGYLEDEEVAADVMSDIQSEYESLLEEGVSKKKALQLAMKLSGIKDLDSVVAERRKKGLLMPPRNNKRRKLSKKDDEETALEKKLATDLPPGF